MDYLYTMINSLGYQLEVLCFGLFQLHCLLILCGGFSVPLSRAQRGSPAFLCNTGFWSLKKTHKPKIKKPNQTTTTKFYLLFLCPKEGTIASPMLIILFLCLSKQPLLFIPCPPVLFLYVHLVSQKFCLQHSVSNGI